MMADNRSLLRLHVDEHSEGDARYLVVHSLMSSLNTGMMEMSRWRISADVNLLWTAVDAIAESYNGAPQTLREALVIESHALFSSILEPPAVAQLATVGRSASLLHVLSHVEWVPWELFRVRCEDGDSELLGELLPVIRLPIQRALPPTRTAQLEETVHVAHPSFVAQLRDSGVPAISVTSVGELAVKIRPARFVHLFGHHDRHGLRLGESVFYDARAARAYGPSPGACVFLSACHSARAGAASSLAWELVRNHRCTVIAAPCAVPTTEAIRLAAAFHARLSANPSIAPSYVWQQMRRTPNLFADHPFAICFFQYGSNDCDPQWQT